MELFHPCEIKDLGSKRVWGALSLRLGRSVFRCGFRFHFLGFWVCALLFTMGMGIAFQNIGGAYYSQIKDRVPDLPEFGIL